MASKVDFKWSDDCWARKEPCWDAHGKYHGGTFITTAPSAWRDHKHHFDYTVLGVHIYKKWPHQAPLEGMVYEERSLSYSSPDPSYAYLYKMSYLNNYKY